MILPSFKRIYREDFKKEDQELIDKLSGNLNIAIETLFNLANHRISFDNTATVLKDVQVKVDSAGNPTSGTAIALGNIIKTAVGTQVILAVNETNPTVYPTAQPFITFTQNGSNVIINNVAGLPANNTFILRVVVWGA